MKTKLVISCFITLSFFIFFQSCEKEGGNTTTISSNGGNASHKTGQNCMNCHKSGGSGNGWFTMAGTVYDSIKTKIYPDATINFYTGPNATGDLKYTVEGDALGNFYTTQNIVFGDGLYTSVKGIETNQIMISKVTGGQCNSCHGSTIDRIWTK